MSVPHKARSFIGGDVDAGQHAVGDPFGQSRISSDDAWRTDVGQDTVGRTEVESEDIEYFSPKTSKLFSYVSQRAEYISYRNLVERTIDVFGDAVKASLWLSTPSPDLQGKVPMQVAQSVKYSQAELEKIFEPIFLRIEHGIYS